MANPFAAKFDSECQVCQDHCLEGTEMYRIENGKFVCKRCAEEADSVCKCGNFKKAQFDTCFTCGTGTPSLPKKVKPVDDIDPDDIPF